MQTENLKCFFVRYVISSYNWASVTESLFRNQPSRLFALLWNILSPFLDFRLHVSYAVSVRLSTQTGIFKINNLYLAGAKRSFPSEAAYYLLYADLGILRANRNVRKLARSPCYIVQSCKHDLNIAYQSNTMPHEAKKLPGARKNRP